MGVVIGALFLWFAALTPIVTDWEITHRGVNTTAVVVDQKTESGDEGGDSYYVYVDIPACGCIAKVQVGHLDEHPIGSELAVRYDRKHPTHARALSDAAGRNGPWIFLAFVLAIPLILFGVGLGRRRRRNRARNLLATGAPSAPVRCQVWKRTSGGGEGQSTTYYVAVFRSDDNALDIPLMWIPVRKADVAELRDGDVIELIGSGVPGDPAALRYGNVVIAANGKTRPGTWEASDRTGGPKPRRRLFRRNNVPG